MLTGDQSGVSLWIRAQNAQCRIGVHYDVCYL